MQTVIVTRTYNRELFLNRAAASLMAQSERSFSWVIVNDGGREEAIENVLAPYRGEIDLEIIHLSENRGMEAAGNIGLRSDLATQAEYACLHDDDDTWSSGFLGRMSTALQNEPSAVGAVCDWIEVKETVKDAKIHFQRNGKTQSARPLTLPRLAIRNLFPPIAFMFRKEAWNSCGQFAEDMDVLGDWDFNLRMLMRGDFVHVDSVLAHQHVRPDTSGANANTIIGSLKRHERARQTMINRYMRDSTTTDHGRIGSLLATADIVSDQIAMLGLKARLRRIFGRDT